MEVKISSMSYIWEEGSSLISRHSFHRHKKSKLLLENVSLFLSPGSVTATLGLGRGPRCLLDCISLQQLDGEMRGKVLYDGDCRRSGFYKDIAVVSDIGFAHFGSLTVFDYLYFGARLRILHDVVECRERARQACRVTGLDGSIQLYQLSPTDLRIASIALEVVANPTLLVVIDPIRDLDAAGALDVLKVLRSVAKRLTMPTTVLYNLPNMSGDMLPLIDSWNVFVGNTLSFSCALSEFPSNSLGPLSALWREASDVLSTAAEDDSYRLLEQTEYSHSCSHHCVHQMEKIFLAMEELLNGNYESVEATHAVVAIGSQHKNHDKQQSISTRNKPHVIEHGKFKSGYQPRLSSAGIQNVKSVSDLYSLTRRLAEIEGTAPIRVSKPIYMEILILLMRSVQNHIRNINNMLGWILCFSIAGVLIGCLALHEGDNLDENNMVTNLSTGLIDRHAYDVSGVLFALTALSLVGTALTTPYLHSTAQLLKAEVSAGLISTVSGWLTLGVIDLIMFAVACTVISAIVYVLVGVGGSMAIYIWSLLLLTFCGYSLATVCAVWFTCLRSACLAFAVTGGTCLIFSGFLKRLGSLGGLWAFLAQVSFTRWGFEALSIAAFSDTNDKDNYLELFGFDNTKAMFCTVWLMVWILILQSFVVLGLLPPMNNLKISNTLRMSRRRRSKSTPERSPEPEEPSSFNLLGKVSTLLQAARALSVSPSKHKRKKKGGGTTRLQNAECYSVEEADVEVGYVPPTLQNSDSNIISDNDGDDVVTLQFSNVNNMFGKYMQIHNHEEEKKINENTEHEAWYTNNTCSNAKKYSSSIRCKQASESRADNQTAQKQRIPAGIPSSASGTPSKAPLLVGPEAEYSPVHTVSPLARVSVHPHRRNNEQKRCYNHSASHSPFESEENGSNDTRTLPKVYSPVIKIPAQMITTLSFNRLKIVFEGRTAPVLQGISYKVLPGTCCCIVDGSSNGNGTLLLQALAGKATLNSKTGGVIYANNQKLGPDFTYLNAAYVQRGDLSNVEALTAREVLRYAAFLRRTDQAELSSYSLVYSSLVKQSVPLALPELRYEGASADSLIGKSFDIEQRINEVLATIGLEDVADYVIGSAKQTLRENSVDSARTVHQQSSTILRNLAQLRHGRRFGLESPESTKQRHLAPSERRCLAIGVELINRAGLIFVDDPFCNLNWQEAERVAVMLQMLAKGGRTVLCSLEKPCKSTLSFMNEMMLLSSGFLVYSGPCDAASTYFTNIGFERPTHQSDLDFVLDIAADRGKMKLEGGKRSNTLSPEDLADLNRSLVNIKEGRSKEEDAFSKDAVEGLEEDLRAVSSKSSAAGRGVNDSRATGIKAAVHRTVLQRPSKVSVLDVTVVLIARNLHILARNKPLILRHCWECVLVGLFLGSVWWDVDDGNYQARISLFATSYICINLLVLDGLNGILSSKEAFKRELIVGVSSTWAYFLSDCIPIYALYTVGCFLFTLPIYVMADLRHGLGYYLYFYAITALSVCCNICLGYLLSILLGRAQFACHVVYAGAILPLQLLSSGYLVLIRTMPSWLSWGASINPMYFYMAGTFRNEFFGNANALGDTTYSTLGNQYDYYSNQGTCVVVLVLIGFVYKTFWMACLRKFCTGNPPDAIVKRVLGVRRNARKLIKAGLRWREGTYSAAEPNSRHGSDHSSIHGIFEIGDCDDDDEVTHVHFGNSFHSP